MEVLPLTLQRCVVGGLLAVAAGVSASPGAAPILWIGDFHGAGPFVRAVGALLGFVAGAGAWRIVGNWPPLSAGIVSIAIASVVATVPVGLDQTHHLFRLYNRMTPTQAARAAAPPIGPLGGGRDVFDVLRDRIPVSDKYAIFGDASFVTWAHYWLLPRLAVTAPEDADWAIFHDRDWKKYRTTRLTDLTRIGGDTWIAKVRR